MDADRAFLKRSGLLESSMLIADAAVTLARLLGLRAHRSKRDYGLGVKDTASFRVKQHPL
jgi:hypothetical protein